MPLAARSAGHGGKPASRLRENQSLRLEMEQRKGKGAEISLICINICISSIQRFAIQHKARQHSCAWYGWDCLMPSSIKLTAFGTLLPWAAASLVFFLIYPAWLCK